MLSCSHAEGKYERARADWDVGMIVIEKKGDQLEALVWSEAPTIYMDTWALNLFSRDQPLRDRFLQVFQDRGTLLISVMLATEIGANVAAERPELRSFLDVIGPHWVPLTIDPFAVMAAQDQPGSTHGCISVGFINDAKFSAKLKAGELSLASMVDLTRGADGAQLKAETDKSTAEMVDGVAHHREQHAKDSKYLDTKWKLVPYDAENYMRPIYNGFLRLCVTDGFPFSHNHARDLFHAIASVGCAHMTLLDNHWAGQARKVLQQIDAPDGLVRIYAQRDVERFLTDLEASPKTRGQDRPAG
jgi:hypothetical protein